MCLVWSAWSFNITHTWKTRPLWRYKSDFNYDVEESLLYLCSPAYWNTYVLCENETRPAEAETVCFCSLWDFSGGDTIFFTMTVSIAYCANSSPGFSVNEEKCRMFIHCFSPIFFKGYYFPCQQAVLYMYQHQIIPGEVLFLSHFPPKFKTLFT